MRRRVIACIVIGLFVGWHAAYAQTNAPPGAAKPPPSDKRVSGEFTPARVEADQEAAAKKAQDSSKGPFPRGDRFYFLWSSMTPAEFAALNRHVVVLIAIWTQKPEELPLKRVYLRADGRELPVYKVSSWKMPVDGNSATAKMYGTNREDGFYLVPGSAMLGKGELALDLAANRTGWVLLELPSKVAAADAKRFPNTEPAPGRKPDLKALQDIAKRKFPGFPVPQSLP
jgi:hypothetical protein